MINTWFQIKSFKDTPNTFLGFSLPMSYYPIHKNIFSKDSDLETKTKLFKYKKEDAEDFNYPQHLVNDLVFQRVLRKYSSSLKVSKE